MISERPAHAPTQIDQGLLDDFVQVAKSDPSNLVHLALASLLQRLPVSQRVELAAPLVARAANAQDHNLPLLIWYGLIPVGKEDPSSLAKLAADCQLPLTRKFIARRSARISRATQLRLNALLTQAINKPTDFQKDIVAGLIRSAARLEQSKKASRLGRTANATQQVD